MHLKSLTLSLAVSAFVVADVSTAADSRALNALETLSKLFGKQGHLDDDSLKKSIAKIVDSKSLEKMSPPLAHAIDAAHHFAKKTEKKHYQDPDLDDEIDLDEADLEDELDKSELDNFDGDENDEYAAITPKPKQSKDKKSKDHQGKNDAQAPIIIVEPKDKYQGHEDAAGFESILDPISETISSAPEIIKKCEDPWFHDEYHHTGHALEHRRKADKIPVLPIMKELAQQLSDIGGHVEKLADFLNEIVKDSDENDQGFSDFNGNDEFVSVIEQDDYIAETDDHHYVDPIQIDDEDTLDLYDEPEKIGCILPKFSPAKA